MGQKTIVVTKRSKHKKLHIEVPGGIINIQIGLSDAEGREVTYVSVDADGDRYAGDPQWWADGVNGNKGGAFRIVCTG